VVVRYSWPYGYPPLVAQKAVALENVDAGWWKRKEAGLVLSAGFALGSAGSRFSLPQSSPEVGSPEGRVPSKIILGRLHA
jgi:hypothetical protein